MEKHTFLLPYYQEQKLFPAPCSSPFLSSWPLSYKKSKPVDLMLHGAEQSYIRRVLQMKTM